MLEHPNCLLWWIAPIYKELQPATHTVRAITPKNWIKKKYENQGVIRYIQLFNNAECFFHSADREDSLRGSGLHGAVIDEAPTLKEQRWSAEIEPSLMDYDGWVLFIGTPKGQNWFSRLRSRGEDPLDQLYKSWRFDSYCNTIEQGGFLKKSSIDTIANDMPDLLRRQEIYAEELIGEGVVFRNINTQITNTIQPYREGDQIVVGSDFGKTLDFSVNIALRMNGQIVGFDRYAKIDWHFQRKRAISFAQTYGNAQILIDSTGVGDPIYDEFSREYTNVSGYKITGTTKNPLIENLSIMLDEGTIWFPGDPKRKEFDTKINDQFPILKSELENFTYKITPSSHIQYNAPEGLHDDCVIALALAAWQLKHRFVPWVKNVEW
jgi:hypothetical protein